LEGQLPKSIEEALTPAAFIESHRVQVLRAKKQLTDRSQQKDIANQRDNSKALVKSVCDEIKSLNDTQATIQRNKAELEAKRDRLLQELNRTNQEIDTADNDLSQIPSAITRLEGEKQRHAR
jgi:chromosome segregation ATPase